MTGQEEDIEFTTNPYKNETQRTFKLTEVTTFWSSDYQVILYSRGHIKNSNLNLTVYTVITSHLKLKCGHWNHQIDPFRWALLMMQLSYFSSAARSKLEEAPHISTNDGNPKDFAFFCRTCSWTLVLLQAPGRALLARPGPRRGLWAPMARAVPSPPSQPPNPDPHLVTAVRTDPYSCTQHSTGGQGGGSWERGLFPDEKSATI